MVGLALPLGFPSLSASEFTSAFMPEAIIAIVLMAAAAAAAATAAGAADEAAGPHSD